MRSVVYHVAVPAQRRAAHLALAEALTGRDAERAAWHLAAAATGPDDEAAAALDAAASLAVAKGAPLAAAAAWERAETLSSAAEPGAARRAEAAEAALKGGDLDRARRLTEILPTTGSLAHRARTLAVRGRLQLTTGRTALAEQLLEEAAGLVSETDPRLAVELLSESVTAGVKAGLFKEASRAAARMADLAGQSTETARFLADLTYGGLAWRRGDAEHGMRLIGARGYGTLQPTAAGSNVTLHLAADHLGRRRQHTTCLPPSAHAQPVKYQYSGLRYAWVSAANEAGGPDRFFFHTTTMSGRGWKRPGWFSVRYDASALTAAGLPLVTEASISASALGSL